MNRLEARLDSPLYFRLTKALVLAALVTLLSVVANTAFAATTISVNFQGRINTTAANPATDPLAATDVAGVVPAANWNNVDDAYNGDGTITGFTANNGTTAPLKDSTGAATAVTLTFAANDSWFNDVPAANATTPNAKMMNGITKASTATAQTFTFANLPTGAYDIYVYMNENGDNTALDITDGTTTFYVTELHQFSFFQLAQNTDDPSGTGIRDVGNFVKFTGLSGTSAIITATHISGSDGCGIAGIQVVQPSGPLVYPPSTITISQQPQSVSVEVGRSATLTVAASTTGSFGIFYQWKKGGTAIPGATSASYVLPVQALTDTGAQYTVDITGPGATAVTSSAATVTVTPDVTPPILVGATAFPGSTKVGVSFNEDLDAASAGNAANYKVNGAAVTSALVRTNVANEITNEKNLVQLTVATALTADFTVTVSNVKDAAGNAMASATATGKILNLTVTDIGSPTGEPPDDSAGPDPQAPSQVTTWGPGAFDVLTTGSNDYWNNADGFNFIWTPKTNSFDVKVRVVSVSPINNWSAGAIEVREGPPTTNGGGWELARHYFAKVDYGGPDPIPVLDGSGDGADSYEFNCRLAPGDPAVRENGNAAPGGSVGWGGAGPGNPSPVPFPNAWIRIARVQNGTNDHLLGYSSSDGVEWSLRQDVNLNDDTHAGFLNLEGNPAGKWPDVCYVGLGSTSHTGIGNNNALNEGAVGEFWDSPTGQPYSAYIIYRDYGDFATTTPPVGPTLAFQVAADGTITLTYTGTLVSSDTVNGTYQTVSGAATSPFTVKPTAGTKPATFYQAKQ